MGMDAIRIGLIGRVMRVLAFAAIALTVIVPPGYMPARAADHSVVVTICTGTGLVEKTLTGDYARRLTPDHQKQAPKDPRDHCSFAGHASPAELPALIAPPAPRVRYLAETPAPRIVMVRPGAGLSAPPPPSHAPPLLIL